MYNFITVCPYGVSSSIVLKRVLQETVSSVSKEKDIEANVESMDLVSARDAKVDAVFTNTTDLIGELERSTGAPVYKIDNLSDEKEVANALENFLQTQK